MIFLLKNCKKNTNFYKKDFQNCKVLHIFTKKTFKIAKFYNYLQKIFLNLQKITKFYKMSFKIAFFQRGFCKNLYNFAFILSNICIFCQKIELQLLHPQVLVPLLFDKASSKSNKKFVFVARSVFVAFAITEIKSTNNMSWEKFINPPFFVISYFSFLFVKYPQI